MSRMIPSTAVTLEIESMPCFKLFLLRSIRSTSWILINSFARVLQAKECPVTGGETGPINNIFIASLVQSDNGRVFKPHSTCLAYMVSRRRLAGFIAVALRYSLRQGVCETFRSQGQEIEQLNS